jgi:hypothetical protein
VIASPSLLTLIDDLDLLSLFAIVYELSVNQVLDNMLEK